MTRHLAPACVLVTLLLAAPAALNSAPTASGRAMADAASALLKDLNAEQRSKASFKFEDDTRFEFRFTPRARTGLPLKEMTEAQRAKAHGLLKTGLSMRGYTHATDIIALENVLRAIEPPRTGANAIVRDPEMYFVSVYGDPAGTNPWGWKFEGHHISVNFTLARRQADRLCAVLFWVEPRGGAGRATGGQARAARRGGIRSRPDGSLDRGAEEEGHVRR